LTDRSQLRLDARPMIMTVCALVEQGVRVGGRGRAGVGGVPLPAVCEVLGGSPIGEVAARFGTSRQSVDTWRRRFRDEGLPGSADRSRRPHVSPTRVPAEVKALVCELRRQHPRWGARRISHELAVRGVEAAPARSTVHRILARNGMVAAQEQQHRRVYRRWQRAEPMHLWQLDIVGGVPLADGRSCKLTRSRTR